ncbi:MAG: cytochrome c biogenesis protein CcsA, partial [Pseudomonadota bacterium]
MIAELGHFALILALVLACLLACVPLWGSWARHYAAMRLAPPLAVSVGLFCLISFACLTYAFLNDDFSVKVVANNSNSLLPLVYKFSAVWGNHEGSLLLWVLILSLWMTAVAAFSKDLPTPMLARVLAVMGAIAVGFLSFSLFTSNPFERLLPATPADGADLNPLLQDPGLIIHPPLLYMGYVGFSVAFAFAVAALLAGRLDAAWARWSRPWTNAAWGFLSLGIMLGSWWAYYELGWGGWWFWDPVENASFMPWL